MRSFALIIATGVMAVNWGCTTMTSAGSKVRVTSSDDVVKGCERLGEVRGDDIWWGDEGQAWIRLKNRAADMGADTVLIVSSTDGFWSGPVKRGEGFRCGGIGTRPPGPPPAAAALSPLSRPGVSEHLDELASKLAEIGPDYRFLNSPKIRREFYDWMAEKDPHADFISVTLQQLDAKWQEYRWAKQR